MNLRRLWCYLFHDHPINYTGRTYECYDCHELWPNILHDQVSVEPPKPEPIGGAMAAEVGRG